MARKPPRYKTFADLVDLADSGATEGRVTGSGIWTLNEVSNRPGTFVYSSRGTSWCYAPDALRTDTRLRGSIKRTADMRRHLAALAAGTETDADYAAWAAEVNAAGVPHFAAVTTITKEHQS